MIDRFMEFTLIGCYKYASEEYTQAGVQLQAYSLILSILSGHKLDLIAVAFTPKASGVPYTAWHYSQLVYCSR